MKYQVLPSTVFSHYTTDKHLYLCFFKKTNPAISIIFGRFLRFNRQYASMQLPSSGGESLNKNSNYYTSIIVPS